MQVKMEKLKGILCDSMDNGTHYSFYKFLLVCFGLFWFDYSFKCGFDLFGEVAREWKA